MYSYSLWVIETPKPCAWGSSTGCRRFFLPKPLSLGGRKNRQPQLSSHAEITNRPKRSNLSAMK
jgi:hypothetical protein